MLFSVEQAFVGREEIRAPLKTPAWEARRNPKWIKKLLLGAEFYVTIQLEGFSTQSQVLLASIVEGNEIHFLLTKRLSSVLYS